MQEVRNRRAPRASIAAGVIALASLGGCVVAPTRPYPVAPGYVVAPPPPVQNEVIGVAPAPGWFWIGGFWGWGGGRYAWHPGHWEAPRPGYRWVPHTWQRGREGWHSHEGHWEHDRR